MSKKIGILASHNGSGFDTIVAACEMLKLDAKVVVVITNNSTAQVLQKAKEKKIPQFVVNSKLYPNDNLDEIIAQLLQQFQCDIIFLSGYMKKIGTPLLQAYPNAIINCHPSLLPKFGGVGMYGMYVHEAVINAKERKSGCTVHFVNEEYDKGAYILQKDIELHANETALSLENRIKNLESVTIIEALHKIVGSK